MNFFKKKKNTFRIIYKNQQDINVILHQQSIIFTFIATNSTEIGSVLRSLKLLK